LRCMSDRRPALAVLFMAWMPRPRATATGSTNFSKLLGGETKSRIPTYCTGNDIEQHIEFGYKRLKLALPFGPADGQDGLSKNTGLVMHARELLGPDGDIMLDCWMALNEQYTIELAEMVAGQGGSLYLPCTTLPFATPMPVYPGAIQA